MGTIYTLSWVVNSRTYLAIIVHDTEQVAEICTGCRENNLISIAHTAQAASHVAQLTIMMLISSKANCNTCKIYLCENAGSAEEVEALNAVANLNIYIYIYIYIYVYGRYVCVYA